MPEFLMEVGCEELPAGWLSGLTDQLRQRFQEATAREQLAPSSLRALATPRRLVLRADVLERQTDREETIWGPALSVARDAADNWTRAAEGFARKNGIVVGQLLTAVRGSEGVRADLPAQGLTEPSQQYVFCIRSISGRTALELLPGIIAVCLRGLVFPKRMSWDAWLDDGKGPFPFGRPIRWLVALLEGRVVPFAIYAQQAGGQGRAIVRSGDSSYGHRFLPRETAGQPFEVRSFAELETKLRERYVLLDPAAREARIAETLRTQTGERQIQDQHGLTAEWRNLVEHPSVVLGRIPAEFRSLPVEVLETVLVHHQKYMPLREEGKLVRFAAVTDTDGAAAGSIVRGMERVVVARLRDAAFFFAEDLKRPLEDRVADLAGVSFHQKLGTYHDKAERLVRLVDAMGAEMGLLTKPEHEAARDAARLAKADLTTLMVREFPELQGVMGGIYLRAQGHPRADVVAAVKWHYHPVSIEEASPPARVLAGGEATVFGAVSLADKLDTLAGYFGIGLAPTGSSDPFGLRRAAQGAIRVLLDFWTTDSAEQRPNLRELVATAMAGYGNRLPNEAGAVRSALDAFLLDRLRYVFSARGFPHDEVEAVLNATTHPLDDPFDCWLRLKALSKVRREYAEEFEHLSVAFKRANNIIEKAEDSQLGVFEAAWLEQGPETELLKAIEESRRTWQNARGLEEYEKRFRSSALLRSPVDLYFDNVLVMHEDARVRRNRLGFLAYMITPINRIADISKLGG